MKKYVLNAEENAAVNSTKVRKIFAGHHVGSVFKESMSQKHCRQILCNPSLLK